MPTLKCALPAYRFGGCYHKFEAKLSDADRSLPGLFTDDGSASTDLNFLNESHNALWERFFNEPAYPSGSRDAPLRTRKDRIYDLFQALKRYEGYLNSLRQGGFGSEQAENTISNHINLVRHHIVDILSDYVRLSDVYVWAKSLNDIRDERVESTRMALRRMMRHGKYRSRRPTNELMQIVDSGESSIGRGRKVYIERDGFYLVWED